MRNLPRSGGGKSHCKLLSKDLNNQDGWIYKVDIKVIKDDSSAREKDSKPDAKPLVGDGQELREDTWKGAVGGRNNELEREQYSWSPELKIDRPFRKTKKNGLDMTRAKLPKHFLTSGTQVVKEGSLAT